MDPKSLFLLEYPKILMKLKAYAAFSASEALADSLRPTANLEKARTLQQQTREARHLLTLNDTLSFQGAEDLRPLVERARHGAALEASELLALRNTLVISREARRILEAHALEVPLLSDIGKGSRRAWVWWMPSTSLFPNAERCWIAPQKLSGTSAAK